MTPSQPPDPVALLLALPRHGDAQAAAIAAAVAELRRLRAERDRLIRGCIMESWRRPTRTLANAEDSGEMIHGWEWRYYPCGDFVPTEAEAVAAVREAAGLDPGAPR